VSGPANRRLLAMSSALVAGRPLIRFGSVGLFRIGLPHKRRLRAADTTDHEDARHRRKSFFAWLSARRQAGLSRVVVDAQARVLSERPRRYEIAS
jgi:hypothetical protein